ncbi:glycosyltransferase family 4 protein [Ornithinimicrobium panacihumi]|uniref:glycosyltransferase family 4 protein n=1 Tax=Ornithinimicrobium panacihumi TaxID=2008449 RepID=UPI003F8AB907
MTGPVTFVSHTNKPGGGELALRRYLEATTLPTCLVTLEPGGVWEGLETETVTAAGLLGLRRALKGGGLIVVNSMRAAFLTALVAPRRSRLVYWVRDGLTDSAMSPLALALTKQVTARRVHHYLANSEWTAATIRRALKIPIERIDVIQSMCGVTAEMPPTDMRSTPRSPLRLLFLGRLAPWKAPDVAVRALRVLREEIGIDASLSIAGGHHFGEERYAEDLRALTASQPGAVMLGHVDDVQSLLASHDLLVHCSVAPEPFGQVIVQGLAAGLPVLATDHGGPAEILAGAPVDALYPPGDTKELARRIAAVVARYPEQSRWASERAGLYTDERALADTDEVLASITT